MISFVVAARNDNYGGDFLQRMQLFTNTLSTLCIRHKLDTELVVVEWNPPQDRERLQTAIKWKPHKDYYKVRITEVPNEIHRQFPHSDRVPLYEFIGKNVGIRRAKGEYILATNPDIIFTDSLIAWLASNSLNFRNYYRATRYDVESPLPEFDSPEELLNYCSENVVQINSYSGSSHNLKQQCFYLLDKILWRLKHPTYDRPFTNASGDFLLMRKTYWHNLKGYLEIVGADSSGRLHIDSMMLFMALHHGLKEVRLNETLRIYHQEHHRQSGIIPYSKKIERTYSSLSKNKNINLNDETWGLGNIKLNEITI